MRAVTISVLFIDIALVSRNCLACGGLPPKKKILKEVTANTALWIFNDFQIKMWSRILGFWLKNTQPGISRLTNRYLL